MGKRISALDLASPLSSSDQIAVVQGTRTKRATIAQVQDATDTSCQCTLVSRYNTVGTGANTLEKFFQTYQMPGDTLSTDGSWLEIFAWGSFAANNNTKTVKLSIGGYSTSVSWSVGVGNDGTWSIDSKFIRKTQTTQTGVANFDSNKNTSLSNPSGTKVRISATENCGNDIAISISGTNGTASAGDITCEGFIIRVNYADPNS